MQGVESGGVAVFYSDSDCSQEISRASLGTTQITVNSLTEKVHLFYAATEKNSVTSTCSTTPARYERRGAIVFESTLAKLNAPGSPTKEKIFAIKASGGILGEDNFSFYLESSCQDSVGTVPVTSDGEVTAKIAIGGNINDGEHPFYVKFTKSISAEQSIESPCFDSTLRYILDTTLGSISSLTLVTQSPSREGRPYFRATVSDIISGDEIILYQSADCTNPVQTKTVSESTASISLRPSSSSTLSAKGDYPFSAKARDAAGNESNCAKIAAAYSYDAAAEARPVITLASPADSPGNDNNPTFSVTGVTSGDTVKIYNHVDCASAPAEALVGEATASGTSVTVSLTTRLSADGDYVYYATKTTPPSGPESKCSDNPAANIY